MDRSLKERIIGAIVLVVFVVLVVPVFLDGPSDEAEVVSERVLLRGQGEQPVKVVVLERDRTEPVPASVVSQEPVESPAGQEAEPEPKPAAQPAVPQDAPPETSRTQVAAPAEALTPSRAPPKIQRSTDSATGMWAVQLGSFSSEENANRLAADLRQRGFAAFLSKTDSGGEVLHRVRIGPQKDRPAAEAMAARLKGAGQNGQVVPHP